MADDERLARLTELARRVWPEVASYLQIEVTSEEAYVTVGHGEVLLDVAGKGRSLDALEAALLVLAGHLDMDEVRDISGEPVQHGIPDRCEMKPGVTPADARRRAPHEEAATIAWVEELAAEWDARADRLGVIENNLATIATAHEAAKCAAELRARARGGER